MKTTILIVAMSLLSIATYAQNDDNSNSTPLWNPPKAACDAYNAEKNAANDMTPAVKALYNASQDKEETRASDIVMPILCNPPMIKNDDNSTTTPQKND